MKTFEEIFAEEYENTGCLNYKGFARKMYDRGAKNGFNQFLMDAEKDHSLYIDLARYLAVRLAKEAVKCNAADISLSLDIEVEGKKYFTRLSSITFLSETKNLDERAMEVARNLLNSSVICSMEDILAKAVLLGYNLRKEDFDD